jgi:two-component system LytT family response regulator
MSPRLKALVADDEPLARARLRRLLAQFEALDVVADCANGGEAVEALHRHAPDVAFLDIQMPDLDGFGVLETLPRERRPHVVFVTAFSEHAVRAFEARAVDYLLKPVSAERLRQALERVRFAGPAGARPAPPAPLAANAELASMPGSASASASALPGNGVVGAREPGREPGREGGRESGREAARDGEVTDEGARYPARIAVPCGTRIHLVPVAGIDRVEAQANYIELHVGARSLVLRETLTHFQARLDPRRFLRVHRSRIVRLDAVVEAEPHPSGRYALRLHDGSRVATGRSYAAAVREALGL